MLVLCVFRRVEGDHHAPAPGFFSCFLDSIAPPVDSFIFFWSAMFKTGHSASAGALPRLRDTAWFLSLTTRAGVVLPLSQKHDVIAHVQLLVSRNPFAGGFPQGSLAALGTSCLHAALGSGQRMGLSAHGPSWIGPFVFFRLFVWLLRSFWILSLPAGYLQSLVAFHYINKFTVYMVAARPGPRSVLCPVYTSGGSWLLFSLSANAN